MNALCNSFKVREGVMRGTGVAGGLSRPNILPGPSPETSHSLRPFGLTRAHRVPPGLHCT